MCLLVTMSVVGSVPDVAPGTYNVGLSCKAERPSLVAMSRAELHAVVYAK